MSNNEFLIVPISVAHMAELAAIDAAMEPRWSEAQYADELREASCVAKVAVSQDGRVRGYAMFRVIATYEAELLRLAVQGDYRRRGLAAALVHACATELKAIGVDAVYLEVRASNSPAIGLYSSIGFRVTGNRRKYYEAPVEDAKIMMLKL